ncbi:hypothetical protein AZI86_07155 [Bdellovibrio bacteriovorus]|uniref:Uncharacterized protein n=1 Tax=Bdellovibrio bacteriovorus TaxID=959 RepID=A0A150WQY8_BDEBC|nr:hypothetical protein [Bdellovibrio bacteriovorus]KYG66808.1 hypothetical protein AZI86_07155 [Bdellovibrio bacteriovorus]
MNFSRALNIVICFGLLNILGCSSPPVRSPWSDKSMRICLVPDGISTQDSVSITTALVRANKFMVVDRARGLQSIKREQDMVHRKEVDRFSDREKYSLYGKLYGCGSVAVAHSQCYKKKPFFTFSSAPYQNVCHQYISLLDSNTAEVIVAVQGRSTVDAGASNWGSESFTPPSDWEGTVASLIEAYPRDFKPKYNTEELENYRDVAQEEALRQRDVASPPAKQDSKNGRQYDPISDLLMIKRASDQNSN